MTLYVFRTAKEPINMTTRSSLRNSNSSHKRERPRWPSKLLLAVLTTVCFAASANALSSNKAISEYIRDRWDAGAGFPGGPVNAFAQPPDGYLWIATEKGLVRFDGLNFVLIEHSESTTVPFGPVLGLALDANGSFVDTPTGSDLDGTRSKWGVSERYSRCVAGGVRHYRHVHGEEW